MIRLMSFVLFVGASAALALVPSPTHGQDNPVLDKLIAKKIKEELSKMHSPETGYRSGGLTGCTWTILDRICRSPSALRKPKTACTCPESADGKIAFNYRVEETKNVFGRRVVLFREDFGGYADAKLTLDASPSPDRGARGRSQDQRNSRD